jgi:hypothetical protein
LKRQNLKHKLCYNIWKDKLTYEGVSKSFRTESIAKHTLTIINTRSEATKCVMAAKLTRLTHEIARAISFAGGQSGNFWIHPRRSTLCFIPLCLFIQTTNSCDTDKHGIHLIETFHKLLLLFAMELFRNFGYGSVKHFPV